MPVAAKFTYQSAIHSASRTMGKGHGVSTTLPMCREDSNHNLSLGSSSTGSFQLQPLNISPCGQVVVGIASDTTWDPHTALEPHLHDLQRICSCTHWQVLTARSKSMCTHKYLPVVSSWRAPVYRVYCVASSAKCIGVCHLRCNRTGTPDRLPDIHAASEHGQELSCACLIKRGMTSGQWIPALNALQWYPDASGPS